MFWYYQYQNIFFITSNYVTLANVIFCLSIVVKFCLVVFLHLLKILLVVQRFNIALKKAILAINFVTLSSLAISHQKGKS